MLSGTGWGTLAGGAVLTTTGYALGYGEAAALGVTCLLAVAFAVLWALPAPVLGAERRIVPSRVSRGDPAEGVVVLTNTGSRARRGLRAVDRCGGQDITVEVPALNPGATHELRYPLPTARRGRVPVGPLRLERTDPLGLVRRMRPYGEPDTVLVRPRTCPLPVLPSGQAHHVEGPASDTADDGSLTFHALREYVLGDDLRRVHWRSTARTGTLMVRQMIDVSLPHTTLVLDTRRPAYASGDDFELAVDCAASIACAAARSHFPVHLVGATGPILRTDGTGDDGDALLDALAVVRGEELASVTAAFEGLERGRGDGALVVVTGDARGLGVVDRVRRGFGRVTVVLVGDADTDGPGTASDVRQLRVTSLDELAAGWRREAVR
ncbi:DUF58 domain-containing protein [Streptomyces lanatus]|uniref:DUF58 domain-containing protein n=1 Tax=Streptomyces lanatus TaxID=66900 RepID=A0ABV1XRR7_9ACTN|nr:DUF58 domain-containing protein [Streptomyces lanatus]GHH04581.1 hypothetical protein GCM10018780_35170 [Streptomyces lanatus]